MAYMVTGYQLLSMLLLLLKSFVLQMMLASTMVKVYVPCMDYNQSLTQSLPKIRNTAPAYTILVGDFNHPNIN